MKKSKGRGSNHKESAEKGSKGIVVRHKDVAHEYDGADHSRSTTVKQAVSVAARLSHRAIEALGVVVNSTCADVILKSASLNSQKLTSTTAVMENYDCRLHKRSLCVSTIRGAAAFTNAAKEDLEDAQVNTIYRVRHWSARNNYRSVNSDILSDQFQLAILALRRARNF